MAKIFIFLIGLIPLINCSPVATKGGLTGYIEEVCIKVGDGLFDGTNSGVSICIYGTNPGHEGACCSNDLDGHGDDFQHGDNDCYTLDEGLGECTGADLGTLKEIKVHLDGSDALCDLRMRVRMVGGAYTDCYIKECVEDYNDDQSCAFPELV